MPGGARQDPAGREASAEQAATRAAGGASTKSAKPPSGELAFAVATRTIPVVASRTGARLQRACACGGDAGPCSDCEATGAKLQRSPSGGAPEQAPASVHDALRGPGAALDDGTRAAMQQRLGGDFGAVRMHTDERAAASARAVHALAYTVGSSIVFDRGRYAPHDEGGRDLLAHELVHTIQQRGQAPPAGTSLSIGSPDSPAEREAEAVAAAGTPSRDGGARSQPVLRRQGPAAGARTAAAPKTERTAAAAPNKAGQRLDGADRAIIETLVAVKSPSSTPLAFSQGPRFVVHDTAALLSDEKIAEHAAGSRGQLDEGAAVYVHRSDPAAVARPTFFDPLRPAATQFEHASKRGEPPLDSVYHAVWRNSNPKAQAIALAQVGSTPGLAKKEAAAESALAKAQLAGGRKVTTSGQWAIRALCVLVTGSGAESVAKDKAAVAPLTAAVAKLMPVLVERYARLGSTVNVEINQDRASWFAGKGPKLSNPAYTPHQYATVATTYLQATLQAGIWPQIISHFLLDVGYGTHCDPRCFDLGGLYARIAALMTHPAGTTYGVEPIYGTTVKKCSIWWDPFVCDGPPPA